MYLDLWGLVGGLVHWLMVDVIGTILNWLHIYALAEWLGSPGVLNIVTILVVALIILIVGMLVSITLIWQERKMLGRFMDRVGTQVGPFGLFQNFADAFKVLVKEYIVPNAADRLIYPLAPILIIGVSMAMFVTIPYSQGFYSIQLQPQPHTYTGIVRGYTLPRCCWVVGRLTTSTLSSEV